MRKKWEVINDLFDKVGNSQFHGFMDDRPFIDDLECVCYAPHIGYRAWIFKYKGVPVCLWDRDNGWWQFHSAVSWIDILLAKIEERRNRKRG